MATWTYFRVGNRGQLYKFKFSCSQCDLVSSSQWTVNSKGYAYRMVKLRGRWTQQYFHRLATGAASSDVVDHVNHNTLDNTDGNLRKCAHSQNMMNQVRRSNNTSGVKGVSYAKREGKFVAYISANGVRRHIGYYDSVHEAAEARDHAETIFHGEYKNSHINNHLNKRR